MALLNDIKKMQAEGRTEQEIIAAFKQQGISAREIVEAISQSKIKEAVSGAPETPLPYETAPQPDIQQEALMPSTGADVIPQAQEAQPSQMPQEFVPSQPMPEEQAAQPAQAAYPEYQQYPAQGAISPDTITEISEQVVSEKLSPLRKDIEKVIDFKTTAESKISYIDERLQRIEKIIDRLNLSIMQKVGDYMTNIDDIKKELVETQKSFKSLVPTLGTGAKDNLKKIE